MSEVKAFDCQTGSSGKDNERCNGVKKSKTISGDLEDAANVRNWTAETEWTNVELVSLFEQVQQQCPADDRMAFATRMSRLSWESIRLEGRGADACCQALSTALRKIRRFRTLQEMVLDANSTLSNPSRKRHRVKHPEKPGRPLTPYLRYVNANITTERVKNPGVKHPELLKIIRQNWHNLTSQEKKLHTKQYEKDLAAYQQAQAKFWMEHPEEKRAQKPKAITPFHFYALSKKEKFVKRHPEMHPLAVQNKLTSKYKKLDASRKLKWIQMAINSVPHCEEEAEKYGSTHPGFEPPEKMLRLTKEETVISGGTVEKVKKMKPSACTVPKFPGAPEQPPQSAFHLFIKKRMTVVAGDSSRDKMRTVCREWKELGPKQQKYVRRLKRRLTSYGDQLSRFKETLSPEQRAEFELSQQSRRAKGGQNAGV